MAFFDLCSGHDWRNKSTDTFLSVLIYKFAEFRDPAGSKEVTRLVDKESISSIR